MKIAIVVRKLNIQGGVQRHVLHVAQELKKNGHTVTLYTFLYNKEKTFSHMVSGLKVVSLDFYPLHKNLVSNFFEENAASRRLALLIDSDTEVIHAHDQVCYKV